MVVEGEGPDREKHAHHLPSLTPPSPHHLRARVLICSVLFRFVLLCSVLFCSVPFRSVLSCFSRGGGTFLLANQ